MKKVNSHLADTEFEAPEFAKFQRSDDYKDVLKLEEQKVRNGKSFYWVMILFAAGYVSAFCLCILAFQIPMPLVCAVLTLEAMVAVCLSGAPIWIHALETAVSLAAGIAFGKLLLMAVGVIVYQGTILALYGMKDRSLRP